MSNGSISTISLNGAMHTHYTKCNSSSLWNHDCCSLSCLNWYCVEYLLCLREINVAYYTHIHNLNSTNMLPGNQVASAKLVNIMSSGVPVPSLGYLFPKLE